MRKIVLTFGECEHYEDLSRYAQDVEASGGMIESHELNHDEETGTLECTIPLDFWNRFKTTDSFEMLENY